MTASEPTSFREVTTAIFAVRPAAYARIAIRQLLAKWWWLVIIPPICSIVAAVFNPVMIAVALIWLLMLLPSALMFTYYSYLLHPVAAKMSLPHTITFSSDKLTVTFPDEENTFPDTASKHDHIVLEIKEIQRMDMTADFLCLSTSGKVSSPRLIVVPRDSFISTEDFLHIITTRQSV